MEQKGFRPIGMTTAEQKEPAVKPLVDLLSSHGYKVWSIHQEPYGGLVEVSIEINKDGK